MTRVITVQDIHEEARKIRNRLAGEFPEYRDKLMQVCISINPRLRVTAGRAWWQQQRIEINPHLYKRPENWHDLADTVVHELAHILADKKEGHGKQWRAIAKKLGGNGKRCHTLKTTGLARKKYQVICLKCAKILRIGAIRYSRLVNGLKKYRCRCGGYLR
jgi:predicted SprT family Zn-dependent metalloprotease